MYLCTILFLGLFQPWAKIASASWWWSWTTDRWAPKAYLSNQQPIRELKFSGERFIFWGPNWIHMHNAKHRDHWYCHTWTNHVLQHDWKNMFPGNVSHIVKEMVSFKMITSLQTQMTKFVPKIEKKCDTHFKKECDITYKEEVKTQNMKVCTKKPQRKCDLTDEEKAIFNVTETSHMECRTHYETGIYYGQIFHFISANVQLLCFSLSNDLPTKKCYWRWTDMRR